jgi:outer membrane protein TolC
MGLTVSDDESSLPLALEDFPPLETELPTEDDVADLVEIALKRRQDLKAALALDDSAAVLERAAELDVRPRVDLIGGTWFTALGETSMSNALDRWVGPSFNVGVDVERPFGNNALLGRYAQSQAGHRQSLINSADLERLIRLSIVRAANSLREAAERVRQAEEAVRYYQETIDAEIERFQANDSTLIDTILTEQQQTEALFSLVSARRDFAELVAQLRFESALLVSHTPGESKVTRSSLMTPPSSRR